MGKQWFIKISGQEEGPFTLAQLKKDLRLTPDTLARREDWDQWRPIREISELKELFEEESRRPRPAPPFSRDLPVDDMVLVLDDTPPNPSMWLFVVAIIVIYVLLRLYFD